MFKVDDKNSRTQFGSPMISTEHSSRKSGKVSKRVKNSEIKKKSIIGAAQPLPDSNIEKASANEKLNTTEGRKKIVNYVSQFLKDK